MSVFLGSDYVKFRVTSLVTDLTLWFFIDCFGHPSIKSLTAEKSIVINEKFGIHLMRLKACLDKFRKSKK